MTTFRYRFFIADNSSSMATADGHLILEDEVSRKMQ